MNLIEIKNNIGIPFNQGQDIYPIVQKTELTRDFYLGKYPVTADEFNNVIQWANNNGYNINIGSGDGNKPITMVNWYDCLKWLNAFSEKDSLNPVYLIDGKTYKKGNEIPTVNLDLNGYRLPLEAEFEYAARNEGKDAGDIFAGQGIDLEICKYANIACVDPTCKICNEILDPDIGYRQKEIIDVGQKLPNGLGLYDMSGNILQWCFDDMDEYNNVGTISNPLNNNDLHRCVRGSAIIYSDFYLRISHRRCCNVDFRLPNLGFRVARTKV